MEKVASSLGNIGRNAVKKGEGFKLEAIDAVLALERMGENITYKKDEEKNLEDATWQIAVSIKNIGKIAAENNLKRVVEQTARSILIIGTGVTKKEFKDATKESVSFLAELTISDRAGTIVQDAIKKHKLRLSETNDELDQESFQNFKKLYEEKYKELKKKTKKNFGKVKKY